jgi:hypothetical protein
MDEHQAKQDLFRQQSRAMQEVDQEQVSRWQGYVPNSTQQWDISTGTSASVADNGYCIPGTSTWHTDQWDIVPDSASSQYSDTLSVENTCLVSGDEGFIDDTHSPQRYGFRPS